MSKKTDTKPDKPEAWARSSIARGWKTRDRNLVILSHGNYSSDLIIDDFEERTEGRDHMSEVSTLPSLVHLLLYQRISRRESNQFSNADLLETNFECLISVKLKGYSINIISMDHSSLIPLLNALLQAWLTRGSSITRPFVWSFPFMTSFSRGTLLIGRTRMQVEARYIFLSGLLYKMTIPLSITNSRCPMAKFFM